MSKINYNNIAAFLHPAESDCNLSPTQLIYIKDELKIFAYKFVYSEADCDHCPVGVDCVPGKGDDVGFSLVFGNYGERTYYPPGPGCDPTVEDLLDLTGITGSSLLVKDVCLPQNMRLVVVATTNPSFTVPVTVVPGTSFEGGYTYTLQVQYTTGSVDDYTECFNLYCHSVCCVSVLFQVEFTDCSNNCSELTNGSFEVDEQCSLDGWSVIIAPGGSADAVTQATLHNDETGDDYILDPKEGTCFALLTGGQEDVFTSMKQTFYVTPGDILSFSAFFLLADFPGYDDEAMVLSMIAEDGTILNSVSHVADYTSPDWEDFAWTINYRGCITLEAKVRNRGDSTFTPYLAIDDVKIL